MKKKILILTANFGAGHKAVSKAIEQHLIEQNCPYDITITDFVDVSIPEMNKPMVKCYEYQTKHFPLVYNTYYYTKKYIKSKYDKSYYIYLENDNLENYIQDKNPDLIISTFPHASACVNKFKERGSFTKKLITVITDVVASNEWIHENTDLYFVPTQCIKNKLISKKILEENIVVTGVPVDNRFIKNSSPTFNNKIKMLFIGGGRGLFDMSDSFFYWLDSFISKNPNMIEASIVTGTNKKLYNKFSNTKPLKNITVYGFVSDMPSKLKEHNLLITKAGGATLFESINSGVPVIVKKPDIGQEIANAKFIAREEIGFVYSKERDLKKIIKNINKNNYTDKLNDLSSNIENLKTQLEFENMHKHINKIISK